MNPPARFVAVRIPRGKVGLCSFGRIEGIERNDLENEDVCRIIMIDLRLKSNFDSEGCLISCPKIFNPTFCWMVRVEMLEFEGGSARR